MLFLGVGEATVQKYSIVPKQYTFNKFSFHPLYQKLVNNTHGFNFFLSEHLNPIKSWSTIIKERIYPFHLHIFLRRETISIWKAETDFKETSKARFKCHKTQDYQISCSGRTPTNCSSSPATTGWASEGEGKGEGGGFISCHSLFFSAFLYLPLSLPRTQGEKYLRGSSEQNETCSSREILEIMTTEWQKITIKNLSHRKK